MRKTNNSKIDYDTYCISSLKIKTEHPQTIKNMIQSIINEIINYPIYKNHKFYIGKTDDCDRRLKELEQKREENNETLAERMFVFTDFESQDIISYFETELLNEYKDKYLRCTNIKGGDPPLYHIYLIIWKKEN